MDKQVSLLYFSPTNTTAKVVKEIAVGLDGAGKEYDITLPGAREGALSFQPQDLVVVGVPVYAGRVPAFLVDYFKKVKGNQTQAVFIVVYGNRDYEDALLELMNIFEENGFIGIAAGAFIGEHSYSNKLASGRPDKEDLRVAREFGRKIKEYLKKDINEDGIKELVVKGKYPYKERKPQTPIAPITNDDCILCGTCATHCPMGAIDLKNYKSVDATKCVKCCSCIKKCPTNAKAFIDKSFLQFTQALIDQYQEPKRQPELFI